MNVKSFTTVEMGLENAGCTVTTGNWMDADDRERELAKEKFRLWIREKIASEGMDRLMETLSIVMPEPEYDIPLDGQGDTAVYVIARLSGEGTDRLDVPGDLRLTETEIRDILKLQKQYQRFMLVINAGGMVDLSTVMDAVGNILVISQPGMTVGDSFADVLLGKSYPSGKLAATWGSWDTYSKIAEFGGRGDIHYREGVYVGYRYFDTVGETVHFPFGHGLGYTDFSIETGVVYLDKTLVCVPVTVKNTGKHKGKEVVQVYASIPEGLLDYPYQELTAFEKTKELAPGEKETMLLTFPMESLISYDSKSCCRILEQGVYAIHVGNSSRSTQTVAAIALDDTVMLEYVEHVGGPAGFTDWKPERRQNGASAARMEAAQIPVPGISTGLAQAPVSGISDDISQVPILPLSAALFTLVTHKPSEPVKDFMDAMALAETLSDEALCSLCTGAFEGDGSKSVIGDSALTVVGAAGETTGQFADKNVPSLVMADGPAGVRLSRFYGVDENGAFEVDETDTREKMELLPEWMQKALLQAMPQIEKPRRQGQIYERNCSAIPIATALAQSWNPDVCTECGHIVAREMEYFGIQIWLAPSMNIQRNPLCGRNFEYYSEDPLLSGKMAAAMTRGVESHKGLAVTIKHFICNNQETNRFYSNSVVNERALRDIYARGFEIVVKEAAPGALMSSYNLLNGEHTAHRPDLLTRMLRKEWGYVGIIMTDFVTGGDGEKNGGGLTTQCASGSIAAGNDIIMPGGPGHIKDMLRALDNENAAYPLSRTRLLTGAARMIALSRTI